MKFHWGTQEIYRPCWGILQDAREMIEPLDLLRNTEISEILRLHAEDMVMTLREDAPIFVPTEECILIFA